VFKRENLSAVHLKDFSFNIRFLANYVQSDDFCFFSSRKRRIKKIDFLLSMPFHISHFVCFHQGKEESIQPFLYLNQSRLEAAPTDIG